MNAKEGNTNAKEINDAEKAFYTLYKNLFLIRKETITFLGDKHSFHIINFHGNNCIDIFKWISSKYNNEEHKILSFQFHRLIKEIYWLQFIFLHGNYPIIHRNLRYILEMITRAYYIENKYPHLSLDEQIEKTKELEENNFNWNSIEQLLTKVLNTNIDDIRDRFKPLWKYLNTYIHPSTEQMDIVATEDFSILMTDSFNKHMAEDALRTTDKTFDIINILIFKNFPRIKEVALKDKFIDKWEDFLPNTVSIIRS